jgi:hypothetical protein
MLRWQRVYYRVVGWGLAYRLRAPGKRAAEHKGPRGEFAAATCSSLLYWPIINASVAAYEAVQRNAAVV